MTNDEAQISRDSARETLSHLERTRQQAVAAFRPPLWLTVIMIALTGLSTLSYSMIERSDEWAQLFYISISALVFCGFFWTFLVRSRGVGINYIFENPFKRPLAMLIGFMGGFLAGISRDLTESGVMWSPYLFALINCIMLFYLVHKYPTGERLKEDEENA